VEKDCSKSDIKKAFRKLALEWHPDKHTSAEDKEEAEKRFRDIGESYEVLWDEESRGKYDRGEDIQVQQQQNQGFPQGFPANFHFQFN
jgi:DnaJ-class molecular chaperone